SVVPPVVPEKPAEGSQPSEATISFNSPNINPKVDTDIVVHVQLDHAPNASSVFLFLNFDPGALQVKEISQGAFVTPGAFSKSYDNGRGIMNINLNREPGSSFSGVVATIVFHSIRPGAATVNLNSAVVRDPNTNVIPVTFLPYTITIQ